VTAAETDGYVDLPVTLSAPGSRQVTVKYATQSGTVNGNSCGSGGSFVGVTGTLTFTPGQTTQIVRVDLRNCHPTPVGTFTFNLSSQTNATIGRVAGTVTIQHVASITSFSPVAGPVGTVVTLTGDDLMGATGVMFGATAAIIDSNNATTVQVHVPAGASTSKITVLTPQGNASTAVPFKVT
jgi:hypothetical protein